MKNPFEIKGYSGPTNFCDRKDETEKLINIAVNNRSVLLHSMRRLGKTGLIHHVQHMLRKKHNYLTVYLDVLDTYSDASFVSQFVSASVEQLYTEQATMLAKVTKFFGRYKPRFGVDTRTGNPFVELDINSRSEIDMSLESTFRLLNESKKQIHIAIDEFQQIGSYPETRMDATLRKHLHKSKNIQVLFSGSQRHILLELFNNPKKPMFASVDHMELYEITYDVYSKFIKRMFAKSKRSIDDRVVHQILKWTKSHTFYTQSVCNRLFAINEDKIGDIDFLNVQNQILKEYEMTYLSYKNILSTNQYQVLKAIAKETSVRSVRAKKFTQQYGIASSTAQQSLDYLVDKELVYEKLTQEEKSYFVYDLFLSRWLESVNH